MLEKRSMKITKFMLLRQNISYWLLLIHNYNYKLKYSTSYHNFDFLGYTYLCFQHQVCNNAGNVINFVLVVEKILNC